MEIQNGKRRKIPLLRIGNILVMMDIYAKIEMIIKRVLHFIIRKWALNSRKRKLLNYRTEENSSVGKLDIF